MSPVFLQLIIIGHLKLYLLYSSVKYVNFRKNEPFVYTCNRYEKYIPQVGAKIKYIADTCDLLPIEEIYSRYFCLTPFVREYNNWWQLKGFY